METRKEIKVGRVKGSMWYVGTDYSLITNPLENDMFINSETSEVYQFENAEWKKKTSLINDIQLRDALGLKLDKPDASLNIEHDKAVIYHKNDYSGSPYLIPIDYEVDTIEAYTLIERNPQGQAKVNDPTENKHIANKQYVDENIDKVNRRLTDVETNKVEHSEYSSSLQKITQKTNLLSEQVNNLSNKKADKTYIEEKFDEILGEGASAALDTIGEISKALEEHADEYDALLQTVGNKANRDELPTKLSELEQDIELGVNETDVMEIVEENSLEAQILDLGTSKQYNVDSDYQIPTTKAVSEIIKTSTTSQKLMRYTLPLTEASWIRLAKVKDINKNSSGIFTLNCYGIDYENNKKIFTTSVFAVNCGYDSNGNLINDVLPITQIPKLKGGESGSSGEDTGSAIEEVSTNNEEEIMVTSDEVGSGASGSYGLASIKIENYLGEIYVCGLVNFPATDKYSMLKVDMDIDNNLNYEYLEELEVVDLDEVNEDEQQVLEGYTLEEGKDYEWRISCNLQKYIDGLNAEKEISILVESPDTTNINILTLMYNPNYLEISGNGVSSHAYIPEDYPNSFLSIDYLETVRPIREWSEHAGPYYMNFLRRINQYLGNWAVVIIKKARCAIKLNRYTNEGVYINDKFVWGYDIKGEGESITDEVIVDVYENDILEFTGDVSSDNPFYVRLIPEGTEIEFIIHATPVSTTTISQYTIANNDVYDFQLKIAEVFKHNTSESYDLFSVNERLEVLAGRISTLHGLLIFLDYSVQELNKNINLEKSIITSSQEEATKELVYYIMLELICNWKNLMRNAYWSEITEKGDEIKICINHRTYIMGGDYSGRKYITANIYKKTNYSYIDGVTISTSYTVFVAFVMDNVKYSYNYASSDFDYNDIYINELEEKISYSDITVTPIYATLINGKIKEDQLPNTEEWTFTLANGETITKKVYIK